MSTLAGNEKLIAVIGATGQQGGAVVRALRAGGHFKVRALSRNPGKYRELADEVVEADLDRPETLKAAFEGAHGVFLATNFWEEGTDELKQATAAIRAAKGAGVKHLVWSTLPDVEAISGAKFHVPHFTGKARVDRLVGEAGFVHHTFVIAPFYYQNFLGALAPQKQADGSFGWALPLLQTSPQGSLRYVLPRRRRVGRDVQLLPGSYLPGFGFLRPHCARQQNGRQATEQVRHLGPGEFLENA